MRIDGISIEFSETSDGTLTAAAASSRTGETWYAIGRTYCIMGAAAIAASIGEVMTGYDWDGNQSPYAVDTCPVRAREVFTARSDAWTYALRTDADTARALDYVGRTIRLGSDIFLIEDTDTGLDYTVPTR